MGKVKKSRNSSARADPTGQASRRAQQSQKPRPPLKVTPQTEEIRTSRIMPAVAALSSQSPEERQSAVAAICALLEENETCRLLTLKERVVQKLLEETIHDAAEGVMVLAWKALRIVAEEEGYDQCVYMHRKNCVARINDALKKIVPAVESAASGQMDEKTQSQLWLFVENVTRLIKALSEASIPILDDITKHIGGLSTFLVGILKPASKAPSNIIAVSAECLSSLTEDNDDLTKQISGDADHVTLLMKLRSSDEPLVRICACAALHNLSLGPESDSPNSPELSDTLLLPTLTSYLKHTSSLDLTRYEPTTASDADRNGIRAAEIALDVIGSIATCLGYEIEDAEIPHDDDDERDIGKSHNDNDSDAEMGDIADDVDEIGDDLRDDMEMVTVSDGEQKDDDAADSSSGSTARYLLDQTVPVLITLSRPVSPKTKSLRVRALLALNNVAWTIGTLAAEYPIFTKRWIPKAQEVWREIVTPTVSETTLDVEVAEAISGVAWAVAKSLSGRVDVNVNQHHAFIALYRAAESNTLRVNCVGVLGSIGMVQDTIEVNKDVGVFLVGLVSACPDTPPEPAVAALNAIFDIYGDGDFAYDEPVFVKNNFAGHLQAAMPKVRTMVRRIDKQKLGDLRREADEAAVNLDRFIKYKNKERAAKK